MNKLKYYRQENLMTQHELAMASGVARWRLQLLENGIFEANLAEQQQLARILGQSVETIFPTQKEEAARDQA